MFSTRTTLYNSISEFFLCTSDQTPSLTVRHSCLCTGVSYRTKCIDLTQKEFDLLLYLIRERGRVFTREDLMQKVWNYDYFGDMRTVDVTVRRLREKIEDDPASPRYILTRRGVGYYYSTL